MGKYEPVCRWLEGQTASELRVTFTEIEKVLGFSLPESAREYPAWWANHGGSHVQTQAWLKAGWKTRDLDLGARRVSFFRDRSAGVAETGRPFKGRAEARDLTITHASLSPRVRTMIDAYVDAGQASPEAAIVTILEEAALERRRRLLQDMADRAPKMPAGWDSTALIREDRDER